MAFSIHAILCAIDFSPFCSLVCDFGAALAQRAGVRLYLFHALHRPHDGVHPTPDVEPEGDPALLARTAARRMRGLMERAAVDWEVLVRQGDPVEQLTAAVDALPPSLVIAASHGVSGLRRLFIGTVVERLSRSLDRPMLVVKPTHGGNRSAGFRSVVVGCDVRGHWQGVSCLLKLLQPDPAAPIHLVHAMEEPMSMPADGPAVPYAKAQQALQDHLTRGLVQEARRLFPKGKRLTATVAPGEPEEMMLQAVRTHDADLMVVGVRPSRRMGRWIAGSTTEALLRRGPCCVLTVPEHKVPAVAVGDAG